MTIDNAIKILETEFNDPKLYGNSLEFRAIKLGVEALKREKEQRDHCIPGWITALPGETEF